MSVGSASTTYIALACCCHCCCYISREFNRSTVSRNCFTSETVDSIAASAMFYNSSTNRGETPNKYCHYHRYCRSNCDTAAMTGAAAATPQQPAPTSYHLAPTTHRQNPRTALTDSTHQQLLIASTTYHPPTSLTIHQIKNNSNNDQQQQSFPLDCSWLARRCTTNNINSSNLPIIKHRP